VLVPTIHTASFYLGITLEFTFPTARLNINKKSDDVLSMSCMENNSENTLSNGVAQTSGIT
jgi:hypothetical protein